FIFFVGAKTRDRLPTMLTVDEIVRRIGAANYSEFHNPSRDQLRDFVLELLATLIRKGPVPPEHVDSLPADAVGAPVPNELIELTCGDHGKLDSFPFEPDAFDEFIEQLAMGDLTNKPSEALVRLSKSAARAMQNDARTITVQVVKEIMQEGFQ